MSDRKTIVILTLSEPRRDPRVRRVASALASEGFAVVVLTMTSEIAVERERLDNYDVLRLQQRSSPRQWSMKRVAEVCPAADAVLRQSSKEVMEHDTGLLGHLIPMATGRLKSYVRHYESNLGDSWWARCNRKLANRMRRTFFRTQYNAPQDVMKSVPTQDPFRSAVEIAGIQNTIATNLEMSLRALSLNPDLVYCNDLDTLLAGYIMKDLKKIPVIFDAHEVYPEQFPAGMRCKIWHDFYTNLERSLIHHTDGRITVCDSIGRYFEQMYESPPFLTVLNVPSLEQLPPIDVLRHRNASPVILYHGAYVPYRGLEKVIQAAGMVSMGTFLFRGFGYFKEELRKMVSYYGLEKRIQFVDPVPINELIHYASQCDIGLNPFIPVCKNTEFALPNKFFEYMMAGLAIASSDLVEMRHLTESRKVGLLFNPWEPEDIAATLNELVADPDLLAEYRRNSYEAARTEFHWEREKERLVRYCKEIFASV